MSSHEYEAPVDVPAEQLFEYVADPAHLPEFLTVVAEAHTTGPDQVHVEADVEGRHVDTETWFHADPATRTLRWGAPGSEDYGGELSVHEVARDRSRVVVHLNAPHGDAEEVQRELVGAIAALAHGAAAHTDDVRAGEQDGWAG